MKFKITRPDGTIIEGEGTAEEVVQLSPVPFKLASFPFYNPICQPPSLSPYNPVCQPTSLVVYKWPPDGKPMKYDMVVAPTTATGHPSAGILTEWMPPLS